MGFALALAWENKRLLLGESLAASEERELRDVVARIEGVTDVVDFRTVYFGPKHVVVTTDVDFADGLTGEAIGATIDDIEAALHAESEDIKTVFVEVEKEPSPSISGDSHSDPA